MEHPNLPETPVVAIYLEGGNISSVVGSSPNIKVIVVDYDNIDDGEEEPDVPLNVIHFLA